MTGRLLVLLLVTALAAKAQTIHTAASASYADVKAKTDIAVTGDTVQVPAGTVTWSNTLNLGSKAISIIGAGVGSTIINSTIKTLFIWNGTGNNFVRLSGMRINSSDNTFAVVLAGPMFKVRIDNMFFNKGDSPVATNHGFELKGTGPVYGVIDHCTFLNTKRGYYATDVRSGESVWGTTAWSEPIVAGSPNMMFIEDCTFTQNGSLTDFSAHGVLYGGWGGRVCLRNNSLNQLALPVDAHGDDVGGGVYGTVFYEIYGNTFTGPQFDVSNQRGGKRICYNNTYINSTPTYKLVVYYTSDLVSHRVTDSHYYNETVGGTPTSALGSYVFPADGGQAPAGYSAANIIFNTHYFFAAPSFRTVLLSLHSLHLSAPTDSSG